MALLQHVITHVEPLELASAVVAAWARLWNETPTRAAVVTLLAQSAHETAKWRAVHCFNLGNAKSREGDGRDYTFFRCREREHGKDVWYDPPHPATRFRAYLTLDEGVVDWLALLRGKRYASAWARLGDPIAFATALKAAGYYTDPVEIYARAVGLYVREFGRTLPAELEPAPAPDENAETRAMGLVALSLRELGEPFVT